MCEVMAVWNKTREPNVFAGIEMFQQESHSVFNLACQNKLDFQMSDDRVLPLSPFRCPDHSSGVSCVPDALVGTMLMMELYKNMCLHVMMEPYNQNFELFTDIYAMDKINTAMRLHYVELEPSNFVDVLFGQDYVLSMFFAVLCVQDYLLCTEQF